MVISVPQKSLSMEPTMPTMFRKLDFVASSAVIFPGRGANQRPAGEESPTRTEHITREAVSYGRKKGKGGFFVCRNSFL